MSSAPTAQMGDELFATRSSLAPTAGAPERPSYLDKYTEEIIAMQQYEDSDDSHSDNGPAEDEQKGGLAFEKEDKFKKQNMGVDFGDVIDNEAEDADHFQGDQQVEPKDELI